MSEGLVLGISGWRGFTDYDKFCEVVETAVKTFEHGGITAIVSGGARGADALAERYAREKDLPLYVFKPDWKTLGKRAGPLRNADIIAKCTHLVAFPNMEEGKGTQDAIRKARKRGIPVYECPVTIEKRK